MTSDHWPQRSFGIRQLFGRLSALTCVAVSSACGAFASKTVTAPEPVSGGLRFSSLAEGGAAFAGGVTIDGAAYTWGENYYGQLGDGTSAERNSPVPVAGGLKFSSLTMGAFYTCGLTIAGAAYCWGANWRGALGDGTTSPRDAPVAVKGGLRFKSLTAGNVQTCGLTNNGVAFCWGLKHQH